jgi:hypothetical protein
MKTGNVLHFVFFSWITHMRPFDQPVGPVQPLNTGPWHLWAEKTDQEHDGQPVYHHAGPKAWTAMFKCGPLVPVRLIEDPQGPYFGWMDSEHNSLFPCMVWLGENIFEIGFPAGSEAEIKNLKSRGQVGRKVGLNMQARPDDGSDTA